MRLRQVLPPWYWYAFDGVALFGERFCDAIEFGGDGAFENPCAVNLDGNFQSIRFWSVRRASDKDKSGLFQYC